jgi:hypothetical protein
MFQHTIYLEQINTSTSAHILAYYLSTYPTLYCVGEKILKHMHCLQCHDVPKINTHLHSQWRITRTLESVWKMTKQLEHCQQRAAYDHKMHNSFTEINKKWHSHDPGWQYSRPCWDTEVGAWWELESCPVETHKCSAQAGSGPREHQQQTVGHPVSTHRLLCKLLWITKWTSMKTTYSDYGIQFTG